MEISLQFSWGNVWVGWAYQEAHHPVFVERPAGFNQTKNHRVDVEVLGTLMVNLIPCVSICVAWEKAHHSCSPHEYLELYGFHVDPNASHAEPNDWDWDS